MSGRTVHRRPLRKRSPTSSTHMRTVSLVPESSGSHIARPIPPPIPTAAASRTIGIWCLLITSQNLVPHVPSSTASPSSSFGPRSTLTRLFLLRTLLRVLILLRSSSSSPPPVFLWIEWAFRESSRATTGRASSILISSSAMLLFPGKIGDCRSRDCVLDFRVVLKLFVDL